MKPLRFWLLLLLAVLLPLRGALAGAMLCPPAGSGVQTEVQFASQTSTPAEHVGAHLHSEHDHASAHAHHHASQSPDAGASLTAHDRCDVCSAYCAVTPLPSEPTTIALSQPLVDADFPDLYAPAPNFVSGGQERPPRSI